MTPMKIALGRWYDVSLAGNRFPVNGAGPCAVAFDGEDVWVANGGTENVARLRASDGKLVATHAVGGPPCALAYDGESIWVATQLEPASGRAQLVRIHVHDGNRTTYALVAQPGPASPGAYTLQHTIAFDGACVWVGMSAPSNGVLVRVHASSGAILPPIDAHGMVSALAFDGRQIWSANSESINVSRFSATNGAYIGGTAVGGGPTPPTLLAFDGKNMWVATSEGPSLWKLDGQTGAVVVQYFAGPDTPRTRAISFDGEVLWQVTDAGVRQISVASGAVVSKHSIEGLGAGIAFDGANMWVVSANSSTIHKL